MRRAARRIRVLENGGLEIVDPGFDDLPLLRTVDPAYCVRAEPLPGFVRTRLQALRAFTTAVTAEEAARLPHDQLWRMHDDALARARAGAASADAGISLLALKAAIAHRLMESCVLCERRCGVNRLAGETGKCGLRADAYVGEHFVHIGEEPFINPSLVLSLRGCALRCRGCQQHALLDTRGNDDERLGPRLWADLDWIGARSLSVVGGNPDESAAAILSFLAAAPEDFALPLVWNNHSYMSDELVRLLSGLVDCYVPDLKFQSEECAQAYTHVAGYPAAARRSISAITHDGVPIIVRVLIMPGHAVCCHIPTLAWLAEFGAPNVYVSLRAQYSPDWRIGAADPDLNRRVSGDELHVVASAALGLGLQLVSENEVQGWRQ